MVLRLPLRMEFKLKKEKDCMVYKIEGKTRELEEKTLLERRREPEQT